MVLGLISTSGGPNWFCTLCSLPVKAGLVGRRVKLAAFKKFWGVQVDAACSY